ncbi:MAG: amino acid ABC transporter substrate-binding protein, partial [bacterium]
GIALFDSTLHQYDDVAVDTIGPNTHQEIDARKSFVELNEANILGTAGDSEIRLQQMSYLTLGQNANLQGNIDRDSTSIQVTEDGEILGALQRGQTLEGVRQRGLLRCGVSQGLAGFSRQDNLGTWEGLDVDYCRALAAAIFGDPNKVEYISLTAQERFGALRAGEIDVLSRNSTWTMGRDTSLELEFVGVNYYDGQALMVSSSLGVSSALELDGKSACVNSGTSTESNLVDFFAENQLELVSISYNSGEEALAGYLTGACDIYSTDRSGLAAQRSVFDNPTDHQILPETISKEPLSPVVREDDPQWIELTRWTRHALLTAEEMGINSGNVDSFTSSTQKTVRLLLGTEGDLHVQIGLESNWAYNIVKLVGNYGEIYERNVGTSSPLMLTRAGSDNALWKDGGLLYAPPIR